VHPRTLEAFQHMGILPEILARGQIRRNVGIFSEGERVVSVSLEDADTPFPFMLGIAQCASEAVLEARLGQLGGRVERGVRLATLAQRDDVVEATLLLPDGRWEEPRFDWVVGCDGAHSAVRRSVGLSLEGTTMEESFLLFDAKVKSDLVPDEVAMFSSGRGMLGALPLRDGWIRFFGDHDGVAVRGGGPEASVCTAVAEARLPFKLKFDELGWTSFFRVHTRMVEAYRKDRVLLAGDAAHIHSPAGGHGMNTGVLDAVNLAWKLALVVAGAAPSSLLDSYGAERMPVARAVLSETEMETRVGLWRNVVARALVSQLVGLMTRLPPVRQRIVANAMEIAYDYRKSPLSAQHTETVLRAPLTHSASSERASLRDSLDFGAAPHAGDRAPDVAIGSGPRLYERLAGEGAHTLLLFDGHSHTADGYRKMAATADAVRAKFGSRIRPVVVVHGEAPPRDVRWDGETWLDATGAMHARYGATAECQYLIRPDGHVGFRSQPIALDPLARHVATYLRPA
jgi:2-polyprenyl-6-methoxyphenol hydroxylase-like FAD-dependent oxidoreductase